MSTTQTQQQNQPSARVQLPKQQGERKGFTNQEIQTIEADRKEPEKWNVIHLLRDGNYWHANEWSAWLVAVVITLQMKHLHPDMEIVPPTAVKKFAKNIGSEYIFVGFQEKSFDKYLPKELVLDWRDVEDGRIDVPIQMPDDHGELTYERLQAAYQKWKMPKEAAAVLGVSPRSTWQQVLDMDFVRWLTEVIVMLDPKTSCERAMPIEAWQGLDPAKSLFCTEDGRGLPIGNLTSQLLSNVYLNVLDQFMKRVLKCRRYGRYVDDFYVVSCDREWLLQLVPKVRRFLKQELGLDLHMGKVCICRSTQGVEFLGAYVRPWHITPSAATLQRIRRHLREMDFSRPDKVVRTVNSYLGILRQTASYRLRRELFFRPEYLRIGHFDADMTRMQRAA